MTTGVNYYNSINNTTSAELAFHFLEYKYPDNQYMDGEKKIFTAKLSKLTSQNNKFDIQLSYLDSNSTDKTFSYKQPELLISNTTEFKGGWITVKPERTNPYQKELQGFCDNISSNKNVFVNGIPFQIHFALIVFGAMVFGLGLWFFSIGLLGELLIKASGTSEKKIHSVYSKNQK
mgnify:CR=1 FL=1